MLIGGGGGIGLVVAFALWPKHLSSDLSLGKNEQAFGNYIKVAPHGRVTVAMPQVETGQGIWTGLASGLAVVASLMLSRWIRRDSLGLTAQSSSPSDGLPARS